ncbi:MAG: YjbQ family protein [Bacteroidetes bacterium]|nr:YjbQ family protein [Bacteroidota bacterium]MBS1685723.1 YjbQ family protein [Bacteroidota bacterium]
MVHQLELSIPAHKRGFHLITDTVLRNLPPLPETGLLQLFIKHTSAALAINENADPSVRIDFETSFNRIVVEGEQYYTHNDEGDDDMPAHVKSVLAGSAVTIPISNHKLNLGTWQGIYLCEFRDHAGARRLVATILA